MKYSKLWEINFQESRCLKFVWGKTGETFSTKMGGLKAVSPKFDQNLRC